MKIITLVFSLNLLLFSPLANANSFKWILNEQKAPPGVVIEIVSGDAMHLKTLLPEIRSNIEKLRAKFPELPVAIVSHGTEQFMMTRSNASKAPETHRLLQSLVKDDDVDFHVCGTHASWFNVTPEDFPEYVDVTPAGPTQIRHYEELGYELIVLP